MGHKISKEQIDPGVKDYIMSFVGDITELETDDKSNIINAVNSLMVDRVDNAENMGKLANAIGEPVTANHSVDEVVEGLGEMLSTFKTNMMNSGVVVESSDKFKSLIDKIKGLTEGEGNKGIQYAEGTYMNYQVIYKSDYSATETVIVNDLSFKPTFVIIECIMGYDPVVYSAVHYSKDTSQTLSRTGDAGYMYISLTDNGFVCGSGIGTGTINPFNFKWVAVGVGEEDTTLRDSLASILEDEGVEVTEEDDMASLISKVDEEFDRQVVPAGNAVASDVIAGKTFMNSTGELLTGTGLIVNKLNQSVNITGTSGYVTVNHNAGVYPKVLMARLCDFKIDTGDIYVKPQFIDSRNPNIYIKEMYDYEGATTPKSGTNRLDIDILNITENSFKIYMEAYSNGDVDCINCTIDFIIIE